MPADPVTSIDQFIVDAPVASNVKVAADSPVTFPCTAIVTSYGPSIPSQLTPLNDKVLPPSTSCTTTVNFATVVDTVVPVAAPVVPVADPVVPVAAPVLPPPPQAAPTSARARSGPTTRSLISRHRSRAASAAIPGATGSARAAASLQRVRIDILTIFPAVFESPLRESLLGRAIDRGVLDVRVHDIRAFAADRHRQVDDEPYGGGPGMVMKPEPVFAAAESLGDGPRRAIVLSPTGRRLEQSLVRELAVEPWLVLICGRYEGVDERVIHGLPAEEISIGDYVLAGGEAPALVVLEAVTRLVPGVVGREASLEQDSFGEDRLLDHPHYTRPAEFRGMRVPEVLLSGNHAEIERWRREAAGEKTRRNRPDLLER